MDEKGASGPENAASDTDSPALEAQSLDTDGAPKSDSQRSIHGIKWIVTVIAILSSTFLFALDTTVVCSKSSMSTTSFSPN